MKRFIVYCSTMATAKEIVVKVIPREIANAFVKKHHYSWKVVANSQLHFWCFYKWFLHWVLSYWPSMVKKNLIWLVEWTQRNEFIELNRMAFDDVLPRNSESRCIAITIKMIKKKAPHIKRIVSFADWCQCWDWTIYRASWFELTQINRNNHIRVDENWKTRIEMNFTADHPEWIEEFRKMKPIDWFMLRYIKLLKPNLKRNYSIIPYSEIDKYWAWMYKWKKITRAERHK